MSQTTPPTGVTPPNLFAAYIEFLKLMLGNLFIMNAGSATALIALSGTQGFGTSSVVSSGGVKRAIICLAIGACFAIAASGMFALVENDNAIRRSEDPEARFLGGKGWVGVLFISASIIGFFGGMHHGRHLTGKQAGTTQTRLPCPVWSQG